MRSGIFCTSGVSVTTCRTTITGPGVPSLGIRIDLGYLLSPVGLRQEPIQGRRRDFRIAGPPEPGPEGVFGRLSEPMEELGTVVTQGSHVELAHHPQAHQRRPGVGRRGRDHDPVPAVGDLHGLPPLGLVVDQILQPEEAIGLPHGSVYGLSKRTPVESLGAF